MMESNRAARLSKVLTLPYWESESEREKERERKREKERDGGDFAAKEVVRAKKCP